MNQTSKIGEKPNFVLDVGQHDSKLGSRNLFREFYLYYQLNIVPSYHSMQFEGELMSHTCENGEKPSFGPNF